MPITILRQGEPFKLTVKGSVFTVRKLTPAGRVALLRAHTVDGTLNEAMYMQAYYRACVLGWDDTVCWEGGEPIAFDPEWIFGFDTDDRKALTEAIERGPLDPLAARSMTILPSSGATPDGSPPTKD